MTKTVTLLFLIVFIHLTSGQTTGPTQPEAAGFAPIGADDMVNLYTGDFNYNIPLMVIPGPDGGYPINAFYNSNVGMDEAASWIGLGWNLNAGAIQRNLRGTPDDFNGDFITKEFYTKPSTTISFNLSTPLFKEVVGADLSLGINGGFGVYYNNYSGLGINTNLGTSLNSLDDEANNDGFGAGLGLSFGSQEGFSLSPSLSFDSRQENGNIFVSDGKKSTTSFGVTINSKQGFSDINLSHIRSAFQGNTQLYNNLVKAVTGASSSTGIGSKTSFTGSISFASSAPLSPIKVERYSTSKDFSFTTDPEKTNVILDNESITISGSLSRSWVDSRVKETPSFGAMYMANRNDDAISDFYRENEGPITKDNVMTPIPVVTYDIFSIQGHGVGGSFRAYQNSIGRLSDAKSNSQSNSEGRGFEIGGLGAFKGGFDFQNTYAGSYSGPWKEHTDVFGDKKPYYYLRELYDYKFNPKNASKPLFEPFYFKMIGEASAMETAVWNEFEAENPIAFDINLRWDWNILAAKAQAHSTYNRSGNIFEGKENEGRNPRTQNIEYFTKNEINGRYKTSHIVNKQTKKLEVINYNNGADHHLNGISVVKSNGVRYNYFLPAYNNTTEKVTFAVQNQIGNPKVILENLSDTDIKNTYAKPNNGIGEDEFFSKEIIPGYAHTFFITSILSQDYVDIKNDGPSEDDLGTYVKFNYDSIQNYKWRFPFKGAYYSKGYLDNKEDDKASFQSGTKDMFYVKSIETKTHVAVFETKDSELRDATGNKPQKQLVSITLYSKADPKWVKEFYLNQPITNWPTPIQTVHLNQDYSLKKGIPNNTISHMAPALKELYFTYQNSTKGENAKYKFNYGFNPDYADHEQDRWGAYQPDKRGTNIKVNENPYTYQEENYATRDKEASAWLLNEIILPSKGSIKIGYEKDDYAYVQDKKATSFFELIGTGTEIYTNKSQIRSELKDGDDYLYFEAQEKLNDVDLKKYFEGIENLRFRVFLNLKKIDKYPFDVAKDYVEGYAEIVENSMGFIDNTNIGYCKVHFKKPKNASSFFVHPFRLAAYQYIRKSRPDLGARFDGIENANPTYFFTNNIAKMLDEASNMITGYYAKAHIKGWVPSLNNEKPSYIRLVNPTRKYGGGSRVKSIVLKSDEINAKEYGQTYDYTLLDGTSSGVAEWEPILGIEENPFTLPIWLNANNDGQKIIFSNEQSFSEEPLGAGLYPSASVGYSKVTVRNLENKDVTLAQSGINVSEFFTAKDFPTKADRSGALFAPYWAPVPIPFIGQQNTRYNGYSMGYSFTLNNAIYGRSKSVATYPYSIGQPSGEPIQKSVYKYKTLANDSKSLDNKVMTLLKEGIKKEVYMGKEIDFYIDEIEANTFSIGLGGQVNLSVQAIPPPPVTLPSFYPKLNTGRKGTRYLTTNKIIYNTPILDSIIQYKDGAMVTTKNLIYDHETGEPIITSVTNEWKEPIFTYNFPAHWSYEQMKGAYKNYRATLKISPKNTNTFQLDTAQLTTSILQNGDEIYIEGSNQNYFISNINYTNNEFNLLDRANQPPSNALFNSIIPSDIFVINSAYKNLQSTKKGKIVSLKDFSNSIEDPLTNNILSIIRAYNSTQPNFQLNKMLSDYNSLPLTISGSNQFIYEKRISLGNISLDDCGNRMLGINIRQYKELDNSGILKNSDVNTPTFYFGNSSNNQCNGQLDLSQIGVDIKTIDLARFRFTNEFVSSNSVKMIYLHNGHIFNNSKVIFTFSISEKCFPCERKRKPITVLHADATEFSEDWQFNFSELKDQSTDIAVASLTAISNNYSLGNPYAFGIKGIWRPKRTSAYLIDRLQSGSNGEKLQIDKDGEYKEFYWFDWTKAISYNEGYNWRWVNQVTKYNVNGASKEGKNRLDIHAASLFGYNNHLVTASASNSKTTDIAFDGFEDYKLNANNAYQGNGHGNLNLTGNTYQLSNFAHTGEKSIVVEKVSHKVSYNQLNTDFYIPEKDKKYEVTAWTSCNQIPENGMIEVKVNNVIITTITLQPTSQVIDGWQRLSGTFTVPQTASDFEIIFRGNEIEVMTLFDDIRIQPFNSGMETYVYDPTNYRLRATLSNQNYATFYNYDEEGNLTQTKVETERGIKTISSNRNNIKK